MTLVKNPYCPIFSTGNLKDDVSVFEGQLFCLVADLALDRFSVILVTSKRSECDMKNQTLDSQQREFFIPPDSSDGLRKNV